MRYRLVLLGAVAVLLALAAVALAATPKKGYAFRTSGTSKGPMVSFVAKSAKTLTSFDAGLAIKCNTTTCGGYGGVKDLTKNSVKVNKGKFKVTGNITAISGTKLGTETVTGHFVSSTVAKGKVTTHLLPGKFGPYHGVTESFTATGSPAVG